MNDISTKDDIAKLVLTFYEKVNKDDELSPFFKDLDFEVHMPKMIHFWSFALLNEPGYTTNVVEKHVHMPLKDVHFERWLNLFNETIDEHFSGEIASQAKQRAQLIGWTIKSKIQ
ncbi:MAG: group III truncated hemoglobin [Crocinitomicaceae bacterium]|jgi:hemoglobin